MAHIAHTNPICFHCKRHKKTTLTTVLTLIPRIRCHVLRSPQGAIAGFPLQTQERSFLLPTAYAFREVLFAGEFLAEDKIGH